MHSLNFILVAHAQRIQIFSAFREISLLTEVFGDGPARRSLADHAMYGCNIRQGVS